MQINEKIRVALKEKGISQRELADLTGISVNGMNNYLTGKRTPDATLLGKIARLLDKPVGWFFNEPAKSHFENSTIPKVVTISESGDDNVILVPAKAAAGYLRGYADTEYISQLPSYRLPGLNSGTYRMFEVSGESMYPTLKDSDLVVCEWISDARQIRDDRVHVIVTEDGLLVKRVLNRISQDAKLVCKSDNLEGNRYPPVILDAESVREVWYVRMFISKQLPTPADYWERLQNLEGKVATLEDMVRRRILNT